MDDNVEQLGQKLSESEYNALLASLNKTALVSMTNAKGDIIYANEKFVEISKYSLNELIGQNHRILKSGHQPDGLFDDLWATISCGNVWRGEIKNRAKDGTYYWVDTSIAPIFGRGKRPDRYISVRFLITERKEKEQTLDGLLSALDQTALVSMTNAKGDIIYANEKFVEVSKYSLAELIGQNHRILKSGHQPQSLFDNLWATISRGKIWRGEIMNKAKDGTLYWVDTSIAPVIGPHGQPDRYISVRFLVTDKKQREDQLEEARAKAEAILASIGEGLLLFDRQGKVERVNKVGAEMLGYDEQSLDGRHFVDLIKAIDGRGKEIPDSQRPLSQALSQNKAVTAFMNYPRKGGKSFPVRINVAPVVLNGDIIGTIEIFRDITQEQELEKAKDEFVSLTSHQLRTPLTAIRLFGELLADEIAGPLNDQQRDYLDKIQESTERMINLVGDILNVSRIETGRLIVNPQPIDLRLLVKSQMAEIKPLADARSIVLRLRVSKDVPKTVKADRSLLSQVVHNLLTNALRYTSAQGGKVTLAIVKAERCVQISVKDNGIGIPKAVQPRIFERFFRADNASLAVGDGTGLGLYLVKMIMENTGGSVWFESEEGRGTTFYVSIPLSGMRRPRSLKGD